MNEAKAEWMKPLENQRWIGNILVSVNVVTLAQIMGIAQSVKHGVPDGALGQIQQALQGLKAATDECERVGHKIIADAESLMSRPQMRLAESEVQA